MSLRSLPLLALAACGDVAAQAVAPALLGAQATGVAAQAPPRARVDALLELALDAAPCGLVALDVDRDGADELIVLLEQPGRLVLARGLRPELGAPHVLATLSGPSFCIGPVAVAPASDAGGPRLAVAARGTRELWVVDPLAAFSGEPPVRAPLGLAPACMIAGDVGRDGRPDVLVLGEDGELVVWSDAGLERRGALGVSLPTCAVLEEDGRTLSVGFQSDLTVRTFALGAAGGPARELQSVALDGIPRDLVRLDADRDGDRELVAIGGDDALFVIEGDELARRPVGKVPIDAEARDLDGDGRDELLVLYRYDERYDVPGTELGGPAGAAPWAFASGDWDGDGAVDLAFANPDTASVALFFDASAAPPRTVSVPRYPHALALGDLDLDRRTDAVVLGAFDDLLTVLHNDGGELVRAYDLAVPAGASAARIGDVDGDGAPDVAYVVESFTDARLCVLHGDGRGGLSARGEPVPVGRSGSDLCLVDLDGDGALECVVADPAGDALFVAARGRAAAALALEGGPCALAALRAEDGAVRSLAVALGGRGATSAGVVVEVVLDARGARLGARTPLAGAGPTNAAATPDLDGDGAADVVLLAPGADDAAEASLLPYLRRGDAWAPRARVADAGKKALAVAHGDLDLDRRDDVLAVGQFSHGVGCWLARAGGELAPTFRIGAGRGCMDVAIADVDGDGRPDVVVANAYGHDVSVVRTRPAVADGGR